MPNDSAIPAPAMSCAPAVRRIKLVVQYDGEPFQGWQHQANGPSVQAALEGALAALLRHPVRVHAAGRTDTGVHAAAMPVHFDTTHAIPAARLALALARHLPPAIGALSAEDAAPDFDARRAARLRWYRYQIHVTPRRLPLGPRAWHHPRPLDLAAIEQGLAMLRGWHDFQGFRSSQCQSKRTRLELQQASMIEGPGGLLAIDFKCRSFLHHMIRFMVGTLVAMGEGQLDRERLLRILERFERPQLIHCAPPCGLCLMGVAYEPEACAAMLEANPPLPSF